MRATHTGHVYNQAQHLSPQNSLAIVIYRVMCSQGIQDGLTMMRNWQVLATQKNQVPPNSGSERKLGTLGYCPHQQLGPKEGKGTEPSQLL